MPEPEPSVPELPLPRHTRLYVACQTAGWGLWTLVYIGLVLAQGEVTINGEVLHRQPLAKDIAMIVALNSIGLLLTHGYRAFLRRRGWVRLPWLALLPRILAAVLVLAGLWTALGWPLQHLLGEQIEQTVQVNPATVAIYSIFNGAVFMFVWSALYFGYHIFERYRRSEVERWQLQSTVKEAELRALKSQINPHFIFNSLNSLRALIDENPARARAAVTQLANLLRYSLKAGQLETVPLEDELRVVDDYLALEQVRHEDRLRVRLTVSAAAAAAAVPPMLVQTLVENAVKFGIAPRREGGEIVLEADCVGGELRLLVRNPGTLGNRSGSTGLGLRNAAQRLRLLYGVRGRLELREETSGVVVAELRLPVTAPPAAAPGAVGPKESAS